MTSCLLFWMRKPSYSWTKLFFNEEQIHCILLSDNTTFQGVCHYMKSEIVPILARLNKVQEELLYYLPASSLAKC